jgi:hypothetical protein
MASRNIPQDSRPYHALQHIENNTHLFHNIGDGVIEGVRLHSDTVCF